MEFRYDLVIVAVLAFTYGRWPHVYHNAVMWLFNKIRGK